MKPIQFIVLIFITNYTIAQEDNIYGNLHLNNCKITKTETLIDTICDTPIKVNKLFVTAKTKVQMSCNFGAPHKNKYSTVKNKLSVTYAYDSSGLVYSSMLSEIGVYLDEKEEWAKKYNSGNDFQNLPFYKSFYISDSTVIPFIKTGSERTGDYQIFHVNGYVFKIELLEPNGLGSLSSFTRQNINFIYQKTIIEFDNYIKHIDKARQIINKHNTIYIK
jgi:hypothetical protein